MLTEREQRIVDWLRWKSADLELYGDERIEEALRLQDAANGIERGDHLVWKPEPTVKAEDWVNVPSVGH